MRAASDPAWTDIPHAGYTTWREAGLAERLPTRPLTTDPLRKVESIQEFEATVRALWGGEQKIFTATGGAGFRYGLVADVDKLGRHLTPDKRAFVGHIDDVLGDPDEVWLAFMRNTSTNQIALRVRVIRSIKVGGGRVLLAVMDGQHGELVSWSFFPKGDLAQVNRLRQGQLIFSREQVDNGDD